MKYITITNGLCRALILTAMLMLLTFAYGISKYCHLKKTIINSNVLEQTFQYQKKQIACQQKKLLKMTGDLDHFKNFIEGVDNFEDKVIAANKLNKELDRFRLNGIGGAASAETHSALFENHPALMDDIAEQLIELNHAYKTKISSMEVLLKKVEKQMAIPSIRPAKGWISSTYGYRKSPFTGRRHFHRGLDIANHVNTPIFATASGKVVRADVGRQFGKFIVIDHQNGFKTRYAHLNKILKSKGDMVRKSDMIAKMGNTGRSTGPHLHYEVQWKGKSVNPSQYVK